MAFTETQMQDATWQKLCPLTNELCFAECIFHRAKAMTNEHGQIWGFKPYCNLAGAVIGDYLKSKEVADAQ